MKFKHNFAWQDKPEWKCCQVDNSINSQDLQSLFLLFSHLFVQYGGSNIVHKSHTSLLKFHKTRDVDFVNNVTIALSNEKIIKIKVVDL